VNPDLLANYDEETKKMWRRTRISDRAQAIIAHERPSTSTGIMNSL
jgi:hypothetical protein